MTLSENSEPGRGEKIRWIGKVLRPRTYLSSTVFATSCTRCADVEAVATVTKYIDPRELRGRWGTAPDVDELPGLVAGLLSQHAIRIISSLCSVTSATVKRWAKGDTAPSRANISRLLFVEMTTRMISYRDSERVAASWLAAPNPWLGYHSPARFLASSDPGSSEWDAVAQAATRFTFGEIQDCVCACEVSPSPSTPATLAGGEEENDSHIG